MKNALIKIGVELGYVEALPTNRSATRAFLKLFSPVHSEALTSIRAFLDGKGEATQIARGAKAFAVWSAVCKHIIAKDSHLNDKSSSLRLQAIASLVLLAQQFSGKSAVAATLEPLRGLGGFDQALEDALFVFDLGLTLEPHSPFTRGTDWCLTAEGLIDDPDANDDDMFSQVPICLSASIGCKKDRFLDRKTRKALFQGCLNEVSKKGDGSGYTYVGGFSLKTSQVESWRQMLQFMDAPMPRKAKVRKGVVRNRKIHPIFLNIPMQASA